MSSTPGPSIPHRTVSSIRAGGGPGSPRTPTRPLSSGFGSPSNLRADEDVVILELGSRKLRLGFAGDSAPKSIVSFSPEHQRRAGDFRAWEAGYQADWRKRASGKPWGADHELWELDIRGQDLALAGDKLERELRESLYKHLFIDSRPRKLTLVLQPTIPLPLLSTVLNTVFNRFQSPSVSLLSSPVMAALAAGTRSALVVDLGWHETTVTAVYEYREVRSWRTIRAGKLLVEETFEFLSQAIRGRPSTAPTEQTAENNSKFGDAAVSFEECEEVATRMLWCKRAARQPVPATTGGLPTLHEHEETETIPAAEDNSPIAIRLNSCKPPRTVEIPFAQLSQPCEAAFFESDLEPSCFDDHEYPVHLVVYRALLQLPLDVRAVCMSRIIFTGGCSNIIGLRGRIFDEVSNLAQERGWDPVQGKRVEQYKTNPKLQRNGSRRGGGGGDDTPALAVAHHPDPADTNGEAAAAAAAGPDGAAAPHAAQQPPDQVEAMIRKERQYRAPVQGSLRAVDSLGPWCGASLAAQLRVPALAVVDREQWLAQGVQGASRPGEVDARAAAAAAQRQSMGPGGLMVGRGQAAQPSNWTLGVWGMV
ncbi:actin-like ATPase domain-containing protein [Xylariaceae sp. FL0804]|nr:actin-like ATPase domain-containing protein [Xylariaceae sp. FL0804]